MVMEKTMKIKSISDNSYYIEYGVVKKTVFIEELGEVATYGIFAKMIDCIEDVIDLKYVMDISTTKEIVDDLIIKFANNSVTPCTLKDVVEDFLAEN